MASVVPNNEATQFKPGKQQVEIAKKGAAAASLARRRKSICNKLLNNLITSEEAKEELKAHGLEDEYTELAYSMYDLLSTSRDKKNEKTNDRLKALEMFMNYADSENEQTNETPLVQINVIDNSNLEKVLYDEKDKS